MLGVSQKKPSYHLLKPITNVYSTGLLERQYPQYESQREILISFVLFTMI